jgi:hypothetical protein
MPVDRRGNRGSQRSLDLIRPPTVLGLSASGLRLGQAGKRRTEQLATAPRPVVVDVLAFDPGDCAFQP